MAKAQVQQQAQVQPTPQAGGKKATKTAKAAKTAKSGSKTAKKTVTASKKDTASQRFFKLYNADTGESFGRYVGKTPKQAACKGYSQLLRKMRKDGKKVNANTQTTIYLRESTRGSSKKLYGYSASRVKLDQPQRHEIVKQDGGKKVVEYKHRNTVKKVVIPENVIEQLGGKRKVKKTAGSKTGSKTAKKQTPTTTPKTQKKSGSKTAKKSGSKTAKKN